MFASQPLNERDYKFSCQEKQREILLFSVFIIATAGVAFIILFFNGLTSHEWANVAVMLICVVHAIIVLVLVLAFYDQRPVIYGSMIYFWVFAIVVGFGNVIWLLYVLITCTSTSASSSSVCDESIVYEVVIMIAAIVLLVLLFLVASTALAIYNLDETQNASGESSGIDEPRPQTSASGHRATSTLRHRGTKWVQMEF
jgi:membrane-associated HD superfamily phosphohydrolase